MKNNILRKTLVIGLIILFVGASVVPSISSVKNRENNNLDLDKTRDKTEQINRLLSDEENRSNKGETQYLSLEYKPENQENKQENVSTIETNKIQPQSNVVEHSYIFSMPKLHETGEETFFTIEECDLTFIPGDPMIPMKNVKFVLPPDTTVERIEVTLGPEVMWPGSYQISPAQEAIPFSYTGDVRKTEPNLVTYDSLDRFPGEFYEIVSSQYKHGFFIIILNLFPLQYIPKTGEVYVYSHLDVKVMFTSTSGLKENRMLSRMSSGDVDEVKNIVDNPELLDTFQVEPSLPPDRTGTISLVDTSETYEYVIITNQVLRDATGEYTFQDLIQSKIDKGLTATIVTVEDIEACPAYWWNGTFGDGDLLFNDTACHIRNFIRDAYLNWETQYVLLGGDGDGADVGGESGDNIIPARGLYDYMFPDGLFTVASDLYYSCLDGSFDSNMNGVFGEPTDGPDDGDVDLMAEVYVGRAPVDNESELSNFVRKTLAYENSTEDYLQSVLMAGEYLGFGGEANWGGNYKDEIKDGSNKYGYTTAGISLLYNVTTLYDRDWPGYDWPKDELITRINNGVHIINHLGHGNNFHVMKLKEPVRWGEYGWSPIHDIVNLTNDQYFFMYSQACYPGAFDNRGPTPPHGSGGYIPYDSIVEHMVTSEHGAFACIANTRYGFGALYSTNGPSQHFDREFFDALYGENIRHLGWANQDSKKDSIGSISLDVIRFCYYEITLFGDPELTIKPNHNIGITTVDAPNHAGTLTPLNINVTLGNNGVYNESDVEVSLYVNGTEIDTIILPFLERGTTYEMGFTWIPLKAGVFTITIQTTLPGIVEDYYIDNQKNTTIAVGVLNMNTNELFDTIQEALDDPNTIDGHNILAPVGVYRENVCVTKNISLAGMMKDSTVIDGCGDTVILVQNTNSVNITCFTVVNGTSGVAIDEASQTTISNMVISDNTESGIFTSLAHNTYIQNSEIVNSTIGIRISAIETVVIDNEINGNEVGVHIDSEGSCTLLYHNNFNNIENAVDDGNSNLWNSSYYDDTNHIIGGNWWSTYVGDDLFKGPGQNISGSDGIVDEPYSIPGTCGSLDAYPFIDPWTGGISLTIYVDDDAPPGWYDANHVRTISEGIHNSSTSDTIYVFNGTYDENFFINKSVALIGEDKNTTIIHGGELGNIITINADEVEIRGFTIQYSGQGITIYSNANTIKGNRFIRNDVGIRNYASHNSIVQNTFFEDDAADIFLLFSENIIIDKNIFKGCGGSATILIKDSSSHNTVTNNTITRCNSGLWLYSNSMLNTISGNRIIHNKNLGILILMNANGNSIMDNVIFDNRYGVWVLPFAFASFNNNFCHNFFLGNWYKNAEDGSANIWDNGYPSGGNYWDDHPNPVDDFSGSDQDIPGSDGIIDTPYNISGEGGSNKDVYPLWNSIEGVYAFANGPYVGGAGEMIYFNGSAIGGTTSYYWYWDFGDGNFSELQNSTHAYDRSGSYTVTLTVTDSADPPNIATDVTTAVIEVLTVDIQIPSLYLEVGWEIMFNSSVVGGIPPYTWHWDFGDGNFSELQNSTHAYDTSGLYTIILTVTDSANPQHLCADLAKVYISQSPPLRANANGPYQGYAGQLIQFYGSATGGVQPYNWSWDFGDGNISYEKDPIHSYTQAGDYIVILTVTDYVGTTSNDATNATITEPEPLVVDAHGPYTGVVDYPIQFYGSATGGVQPYTWNWDFGDDTNSSEQNPVHSYTQAGEYIVILTVTDYIGKLIDNFTTAFVYSGPLSVFVDDDYNNTTEGWGYTHFDNIQDGIDLVRWWGTVTVYEGTYYGHVSINKPLNIIGEDRNNTIIDCSGNNSVVEIHVDGAIVSGFTIQSSGGDSWTDAGIKASSNNNIISGNNIIDNNNGIFLDGSSNNVISGNNIIDNTEYGACVMWNSFNNEISGNTIRNNFDCGVYVAYSSNIRILGNTIANNHRYGIRMYGSSNSPSIDNIVSENMIANNDRDGIYLCKISNTTIAGNNITENDEDGIKLYESSGIVVSENSIIDNIMGIYISDSSEVVISDNIITNNDNCGIYLCGEVFDSDLIRNSIINNNRHGICLWSSFNNTICENILLNNNEYGINIADSQNNAIYHNAFINNNDGNAYDEGENIWDDGYPSGGNYWDNHPDFVDEFSGPGQNISGSDAIVDTPYGIPGSEGDNQDRYPLMSPYGGSVINLDTSMFFSTIQQAIDDPETLSGHTIYVLSGTYSGTISVSKAITLKGADRDTTIIDGDTSGDVVQIHADGAIVSGFTIRNSGSDDAGIYINADYTEIFNNNIQNNNYGIYVNEMSNNLFYHDNFINNTQHVHDNGVNNWDNGYPCGGNYWDTYSGSDGYCGPDQDIIGSDGIGDTPYVFDGVNQDMFPLINPWDGTSSVGLPNIVYVDDDYNETIYGWGYNHFDTVEDGITAVAEHGTVDVEPGIYYGSFYDGVTLVDKPVDLIGVNKTTTIIDGNGSDLALYIGDPVDYDATINDVTVSGFTVRNSMYGIGVGYSDNITIADNIIKDILWLGIYMVGSSNSNISQNMVTNTTYSIFLGESSYNVISNNTIGMNNIGEMGVYLEAASDNTITGNTISHHQIGALLYYSANNSIYENVITNNDFGITTDDPWGFTMTSGDSSEGLAMTLFDDEGFFVMSSDDGGGGSWSPSSNNTIYHNNFIDNNLNAWDDSSSNTWYNATLMEGNYWSDFDEPSEGAYDNNTDDIVDSPYNISGGSNQDLYPFINPDGWLNNPPTADAGGPYEADEGTEIIFDASESYDPDNDELQYRWDFDNDGFWDTSYSVEPTVTHTWYDDYTGTIAVQVYDSICTDVDTTTVTVNNVAPVVNAGVDQTADEGDLVTVQPTFLDAGSSDTHTAVIDWGDRTPSITIDPATSPLSDTHVYGDNGVYTVIVTVTDDDGGVGSDILTMTINNVAPIATIDNVIQPFSGFILPSDELEFHGSFMDPGTNDTHTTVWDFGDYTGISTGLITTHAYTYSGNYTVTFTVTDDDGDVGVASVDIQVLSPVEAIQDIIEDIQEMNLPRHIEDELLTTLNRAIRFLNNNQTSGAVSMLDAFIYRVEELRGRITDEEADALIAAAQWIIDHLKKHIADSQTTIRLDAVKTVESSILLEIPDQKYMSSQYLQIAHE